MASLAGGALCSASEGNAPGSVAISESAGPATGHSVLVLNRLYMAVHVVNVKRAIALLFRELAEVIDLSLIHI